MCKLQRVAFDLILEKCNSSWGKPSDCNYISEFQEELTGCSKSEPFCETKFGGNLAEIWRKFGEIQQDLANFGGIALWQLNLGYFG